MDADIAPLHAVADTQTATAERRAATTAETAARKSATAKRTTERTTTEKSHDITSGVGCPLGEKRGKCV